MAKFHLSQHNFVTLHLPTTKTPHSTTPSIPSFIGNSGVTEHSSTVKYPTAVYQESTPHLTNHYNVYITESPPDTTHLTPSDILHKPPPATTEKTSDFASPSSSSSSSSASRGNFKELQAEQQAKLNKKVAQLKEPVKPQSEQEEVISLNNMVDDTDKNRYDDTHKNRFVESIEQENLRKFLTSSPMVSAPRELDSSKADIPIDLSLTSTPSSNSPELLGKDGMPEPILCES